jgi:hypothetical protein
VAPSLICCVAEHLYHGGGYRQGTACISSWAPSLLPGQPPGSPPLPTWMQRALHMSEQGV